MHVYIETYGCTANKSDEHLIVSLLKHEGHEIVYTFTEADVLVIITCTVIGTTEQRMLSRLKVFQKTHKKIIVTGCMPVVQPDQIKAVAPDALLLPPQYIQYITNMIQNNKSFFLETKKSMVPKFYNEVIAPIMIAEGCRFSCAYCITHIARGELRSFPVQEITAGVLSAIKQGCKEIQLTAQDTASYGLDISINLGALLTHICNIDGDFRIRVGMMNPITLKKNIKSILAAYQHYKIYKFLHLPLQSGDDNILKRMIRGYTAQAFINLVEQFKKKLPSLTLSTDVIIGFPTETEEQFHKTIDVLKQIKPDIINITRFSARPFTVAKNMNGRIPTHIVKGRSKQIAEICSKISLEKNQEHIKNKYIVLVTEKGKQKTFKGRTENYKQVVLTEQVTIGDFIKVKIIDATPTYLVGKLI